MTGVQTCALPIQIDIRETSQDRVTSAIQGLLLHAYFDLAIGNDDRYENLRRLANRVYQRYDASTAGSKGRDRIPLPPYNDLNREVMNHLLDPQAQMLPYAARAVLRTHFGLPAESAAPASNAPNAVETVSTNSVPTNVVSPALP